MGKERSWLRDTTNRRSRRLKKRLANKQERQAGRKQFCGEW